MKKILLLIFISKTIIPSQPSISIEPCPQENRDSCLKFLIFMQACHTYNKSLAGFKKCSEDMKKIPVEVAPNLEQYIQRRINVETELYNNKKSPEADALNTLRNCVKKTFDPRERGRCIMSQLAGKMSPDNLQTIANEEGYAQETLEKMQENFDNLPQTFCND